MKLSEIKPQQTLQNLEFNQNVTVVTVTPHSDECIEITYRLPNGTLQERILYEGDAERLAVAESTRPWAFDGDPILFQLACEAYRIDFAYLFDPMMAVHTSNVDPLPHQITAVYEALLPKQPLRFILADDPGAGKTVMAGLYIRELIMRADSRRILIVAPGSLVEQWQDELRMKFGLDFTIFANTPELNIPGANPFEKIPQWIVRLDQMSRNEELRAKLIAQEWDLVIFDEAHKLAAHYFGNEVKETGRFRLAKDLSEATRNLLLMTATPHNGKEEDFQLFLSLLDADQFYGKFRSGRAQKTDVSDLLRRMVKEDMVKFDGTPLFPPRIANTVTYPLSELERELYERVTEYVRSEMGKFTQLNKQQRNSVGFALTTLQRRLASSPEAIYQSLTRRKNRLSERVRLEKEGRRPGEIDAATVPNFDDDDERDEDDLTADEQEAIENEVTDQASTARTIAELETEIRILEQLENQAKEVVRSGEDCKWKKLSEILNNSEMKDAEGRMHKLIIFTEHRDTLNYLYKKIVNRLGKEEAVLTIHGGTPRDERHEVQARFRQDPNAQILIATDAAGEGVNLQCAHLMVNYDLPWNPNRLEQRFGRIHRIKQRQVCHLWNIIAAETREGEVYLRLLEKIDSIKKTLKDRVFNVLGTFFEEVSLKDLMIEAILLNEQPEAREHWLKKKFDQILTPAQLELLEKNGLAMESFTAERILKVKDDLEKAEARRLQPHFIHRYFKSAFDLFKGTMHQRETGRWELTYVPPELRERERSLTGRPRRDLEPILPKYKRITFTKDLISLDDRPGSPQADLMHPGHPLMLTMTDLIINRYANLLRQGTVLIDPTNSSSEPWLMYLLLHEIHAAGEVVSKRLQFVRMNRDGTTEDLGWAPHLDYLPLEASAMPLIEPILNQPWDYQAMEKTVKKYAITQMAPKHIKEVAEPRRLRIEKQRAAIHQRLTQEITYLSGKLNKAEDDLNAGKKTKLNIDNLNKQIAEIANRLDQRRSELDQMLDLFNQAPVVLGGAMIIPQELFNHLQGIGPAPNQADVLARQRIERLAMQAVRAHQEALGHRVDDVSAQKCGWDLTSYPPGSNETKHIEVKGRIQGATTICVTHNEVMYARNQADKFVLAIVFVSSDDRTGEPIYLANPFTKELDSGVVSVNYDIKGLIEGRRA